MKQLSGSSGLQFFEPGGIGPGGVDVPVGDGEPVGVGVTDVGAMPVGPAEDAGGVDPGGDDAAEAALAAEE